MTIESETQTDLNDLSAGPAKRVYSVNLDRPDPRVVKTIRRALAWCDLHLSDWRPRHIHSKWIIEAFGPDQQGRIGSYLRDALLNKVEKHLSTHIARKLRVQGHAASYVLNKKGYEELCARYSYERLEKDGSPEAAAVLKEAVASVFPTHQRELQSLEFTYTVKSDRYWHRLQNIRREKKAEFWNLYGLRYNYDIAACAPSILLQLAQRKGASKFLTAPVEEYLADRRKLRQHVSKLTGLSYDESKRLINSLFNGARLFRSRWCSASRNYGGYVVDLLIGDSEVRRLRVAIRAMWMVIGHYELVEVERLGMKAKGARKVKVRRAKDKWAIYFKHERAVLDLIKEWLTAQGIKHFTEHDGFRTTRQINIAALEQIIEDRTGFQLRIEEG